MRLLAFGEFFDLRMSHEVAFSRTCRLRSDFRSFSFLNLYELRDSLEFSISLWMGDQLRWRGRQGWEGERRKED